MRVLRRADVRAVLDGEEKTVLDVVARTYAAHDRGEDALPHSVFLRFPGNTTDRVIGLPAYVGGSEPAIGMKWIASFPGNVARGGERATAAILLNSPLDGSPVALVEGAVVSARRTAASAALAAGLLLEGAPEGYDAGVSLVGCGVVNREVLRFLRARLPALRRVTLMDHDRGRAASFAASCRTTWPELEFSLADDHEEALRAHRLVSLATTAGTPYLSLDACAPGTVVLHLSLRDVLPESILKARNVVDDTDHVCRADTSLDLAARERGDRGFVEAEIGALVRSGAAHDPTRTTVFSPFGLGTLDTALAAHVLSEARSRGLGTDIADFLT
ncbi:2,3-diaminopropionate biosynthesis protein SbnB [Nocardiopsis sp. NPDC006938]|uniref:2,3-diaminopropionate biosynthesis protein SbnB n=1 Tax=Nocardiopsis sp. NPDC006938 TaxID=3364337 RepID=UPI00368ECF1B